MTILDETYRMRSSAAIITGHLTYFTTALCFSRNQLFEIPEDIIEDYKEQQHAKEWNIKLVGVNKF